MKKENKDCDKFVLTKEGSDAIERFLRDMPIQFYIEEALIKTSVCIHDCGHSEWKRDVLWHLSEALLAVKHLSEDHQKKGA